MTYRQKSFIIEVSDAATSKLLGDDVVRSTNRSIVLPVSQLSHTGDTISSSRYLTLAVAGFNLQLQNCI